MVQNTYPSLIRDININNRINYITSRWYKDNYLIPLQTMLKISKNIPQYNQETMFRKMNIIGHGTFKTPLPTNPYINSYVEPSTPIINTTTTTTNYSKSSTTKNSNMCVICDSNDITMIALPCKHFNYCNKCSKNTDTCVICYKHIDKWYETNI